MRSRRRGTSAWTRRRPVAARGAARCSRARPAGRRRVAARVVVLDLVVVPDRRSRKRALHLAQRLVRAVQRVLVAVVVQRVGDASGRRRWRPIRVVAHAVCRRRPTSRSRRRCSRRGRRRSRGPRRHQLVRVVEAVRVLLAGEEGEAQRLARVGRQRGAEAADLAPSWSRSRSGRSTARGLQAGHARLDAAARRGLVPIRSRATTLAEVLLSRATSSRTRPCARARHARPERDRPRRGVAGRARPRRTLPTSAAAPWRSRGRTSGPAAPGPRRSRRPSGRGTDDVMHVRRTSPWTRPSAMYSAPVRRCAGRAKTGSRPGWC